MQNYANDLYQMKFMKHPCMAMCKATNRTVIRARYEKEEEPLSVGGGEGVIMVGNGRSTITCNLAVATRHYRTSTFP